MKSQTNKLIQRQISLAIAITMTLLMNFYEMPFGDNILQPFQFELIFTAAEIRAKKDIACTSAWSLIGSYITELEA